MLITVLSIIVSYNKFYKEEMNKFHLYIGASVTYVHLNQLNENSNFGQNLIRGGYDTKSVHSSFTFLCETK